MLPEKENSNSHGARPVFYNHLDDSVVSIVNSVSLWWWRLSARRDAAGFYFIWRPNQIHCSLTDPFTPLHQVVVEAKCEARCGRCMGLGDGSAPMRCVWDLRFKV